MKITDEDLANTLNEDGQIEQVDSDDEKSKENASTAKYFNIVKRQRTEIWKLKQQINTLKQVCFYTHELFRYFNLFEVRNYSRCCAHNSTPSSYTALFAFPVTYQSVLQIHISLLFAIPYPASE